MRRKADSTKEKVESPGAIAKALTVLEFVSMRGETQFGTIGQHVKLPKSTLHRILNSLVQEGLIVRNRHGGYRGGLKLWQLGAHVTNYDAIREMIPAMLRQLVAKTSETAHYAIYENGWSVYVAKADAIHAISAGTSVGGRSPAYASATGKAVLAWREEAEISAIGSSAERLTATTLIGGKALLAEAAEIRRAGFATSRGELYIDLWSVAAPIREPTGEIRAAIGVAGPATRVKANLRSYTKVVVDAAATLSRMGKDMARLGAGMACLEDDRC